MELRRLAAEGGDTDRVLEEATGVGVVVVGGRRIGGEIALGEHGAHRRGEPGVRDLVHEELEEALELRGVSAQRGRQARGIDVRRLERPYLELQPVAEPLDPSEHAHGVPFREAPVQELDIVPDPGVDVPARVDELEHEVRRAALRAQPPLRLDGEHTLDDAVGDEIGDHAAESIRRFGSLKSMSRISPFRALRYDMEAAGPLQDLVAPPYDVIDADSHSVLWHQSEYNIVHLTRPVSPELAAENLADWREKGVLREEPEPALWWIEQEYTGPDGVARKREGIAGSIEATPYSAGKVLPHELTHADVKELRLAILRATRTQLEPIFLLYDAEVPVEAGGGDPVMEVDDRGVATRVWRLESDGVDLDVPFLIADGHHRYETAVAFREEEPTATHTFAVLVSSRSRGVEIFPTHRVVREVGVKPFGFMTSIWDTTSLAMYQTGHFYRLESDDDLDTREIERYELEGVEYTPSAEKAVQAVDDELAQLAFLVRAPSVGQVFEYAARGEAMPQKTTFFYPKLTSGLLLHPI